MLSLFAAFHIDISFVALPISNTPLNLKNDKDRAVYLETKCVTPVSPSEYSSAPLPESEWKQKKKADFVSIVKFKVTAYCPCKECSDGYGNITSTGVIAEEGRTIAVDPSVIPYGTTVRIEGVGEFVAEDCGGDVKGEHIDIYFESHEKTVSFGVKYKKIESR